MSDTPKLQAPGAGLPFIEGLIARLYVGGYLSKQGSAEKNWRPVEHGQNAATAKRDDFGATRPKWCSREKSMELVVVGKLDCIVPKRMSISALTPIIYTFSLINRH